MTGAPATALVVFGATGDLAHRKIYPALAALAGRRQLPPRFALVGVARTRMSRDDFVARIRTSLSAGSEHGAHAASDLLDGREVHYLCGEAHDPATFRSVADRLAELGGGAPAGGDGGAPAGATGGEVPPVSALFYLATIPGLFAGIATGLGEAGLAREPEGAFRRLVIEKPFGHDVPSAVELDHTLHRHWHEHQLFRIDHYLAKETVQNILALRFANSVYEPIWNRRYVDHVQITVAEQLGVEHRGTFYEGAGALRDIVQNHVLQVLALTAMEAPVSFHADSIRDEKVKLLRSIHAVEPLLLPDRVVRGQYGPGTVDGREVAGYRDEEGVDDASTTETYVALALEIDNWRWAGVPFYLRTGKRLPKRVTEVALRYRQVPHLPLPRQAIRSLEPNTLIVTVQPDEGIEMRFGAKVPHHADLRTVSMRFCYDAEFGEPLPEAYERVLHDALTGDASIFIRADEVEHSWRVVQPLLDGFAADAVPLYPYPAGSWGPREAAALLARHQDSWRAP